MLFELKIEGKDGALFHTRMPSIPKVEEMQSLFHLARNVAGIEGSSSSSGMIHGPFRPLDQTKLGEKPVDKIDLGNYVEPLDGFRIRMLQLPETSGSVVGAIKHLRPQIPISLFGWREILLGNFRSPMFDQADADFIRDVLKDKGILAKIVPAIEG